MIGDQEVRVLQFLLEDGPAWGKEIAEHLGMTEWKQIQSGTYIGNKLARAGMVERKMMCGDRSAPPRAYFIISEAGTAALSGVVGGALPPQLNSAEPPNPSTKSAIPKSVS